MQFSQPYFNKLEKKGKTEERVLSDYYRIESIKQSLTPDISLRLYGVDANHIV